MEVNKLNIVCFLWYGKRWAWADKGLGVEYVNRLYRGVQRNLTLPHRFICLTNEKGRYEKGIEILPLNSPNWDNAMPKLCMFDPALGLKGRVFSIDIDVVITGNLNELCSYNGDFAVRSSFPPRKHHLMDGDVVAFPIGKWTDIIWKPFKICPAEVSRLSRARESFWYRRQIGSKNEDNLLKLYPRQFVGYKYSVKRKGVLPKNARMVSCHSNPRPHMIQDNWIKKHWK